MSNDNNFFNVVDNAFALHFPNRVNNNGLYDFRDIMLGYCAAAIWSSSDDVRLLHDTTDNETNELDYQPLDELGFTIYNIHPDSLKTMCKNVADFILANLDDSLQFIAEHGAEQYGQTLWLNCAGHGSGFFDWSDDYCKRLADACRHYGNYDRLYIGDVSESGNSWLYL